MKNRGDIIRGTSRKFPEDVSIALDIDGVGAHFAKHFVAEARKMGVDYFDHHHQWTQYKPEDKGSAFKEVWDVIVEDHAWWTDIPEKGWVDFPVDRYITSRPIPSDVTRTWIQESSHLPDAPVHTVGMDGSKEGVIAETGTDVYVDDHSWNVKAAYRGGAVGILHETPVSRRSLSSVIGESKFGMEFTAAEVSIGHLPELKWFLTEQAPAWLMSAVLGRDPHQLNIKD